MTETVLIVEDDDNLRETLADILEIEGYTIFAAANLLRAGQLLNEEHVDICILDIMLPDGEGYNFAKVLREQSPTTMILMLTAKNLNQDVEAGFESGADDYVSKPYQLNELLLRIRALLRRKSSATVLNTCIFTLNGFSINRDARDVTSPEGVLVHLTKKEFDLLCHFIDRPDKVQSRNELLDAVWGRENYIDHRTVDNFVSKLKRQFRMDDESDFTIRSIRGVGYCMYKHPPAA